MPIDSQNYFGGRPANALLVYSKVRVWFWYRGGYGIANGTVFRFCLECWTILPWFSQFRPSLGFSVLLRADEGFGPPEITWKAPLKARFFSHSFKVRNIIISSALFFCTTFASPSDHLWLWAGSLRLGWGGWKVSRSSRISFASV